MKSRFTKEQLWMQRYEKKFLEINPDAAGRLDWNSAKNAFYQGKVAEEAAILIAGMGRGVRA